jgi:DNA-binding transcriptional LysR family regulator
MIENYLLEELVTFQKLGTLQKTAAQLAITQPTVTRGMQKLEEELGVKLFDRQPNRIQLTAAGELAAKEAAAVLEREDQMVTRVQNFVAQNRALKIGAVMPGPLIILEQMVGAPLFNHQINHRLLAPAEVEATLFNDQLGMVVTNVDLTGGDLVSLLIGEERLFVALDRSLPQANQTAVSFADLAGMSFIVLDEIGAWKDVIDEEIKDAHFMYQNECNAMAEIIHHSNFPYFTTNVTIKDEADRVKCAIKDPKAVMPIYATLKRSRYTQVARLVERMKARWAKLPTSPSSGGTNVLK